MTSTVFSVGVVLVAMVVAVSPRADEAIRPLTITATSLRLHARDARVVSLGKLLHRGTLQLSSPDKDFGGLSGLIVTDDGRRFLAISDCSHWVTGTLSYLNGRLVGIGGMEIAPLLDPAGHALIGKQGDAEGLTGSLDGDVFVSFEGEHRIWRYDVAHHGLAARAVPVVTPPELADAPKNKGLEGITLLSDGRLLALTEAYRNAAGDFRGWLIDPATTTAQELALRSRASFELTDVRQLPNGDLLTLERRFSPLGGLGFEIRRIPAALVTAGALLDGEVIAKADQDFIIDNMEGLSVRVGSRGEIWVYVISDDNFFEPLQHTLLMMFELKE